MYWNINRGAPHNKDSESTSLCERTRFPGGQTDSLILAGNPCKLRRRRGNGGKKRKWKRNRKFPHTFWKEREEVKKKRNEVTIEGKVNYPISHNSSSSFKQTFKIFNFFFVWPDRTNHQILFKYILPFVPWNTANF